MDIVMLLFASLVGASVAVVLLRDRSSTVPPESEITSLAHRIEALVERVSSDSTHLARHLEGIDGRMTQTQIAGQEMAREVFGKLGDVERATAAVAEQARQFSSLQDILRAPKARGGLGEAMLEELLSQVLPPQAFARQHRFASGTIVDAVVFAGGRKICIDSKFPLENYQRMCEATDDAERSAAQKAFAADVEGHIRDIAARYIVPDEDTLDFAVMYVPAEGVYAEVLRSTHKRPLFETAIAARVVPMSPLTMYGYLQTILFGLRCLKIEESAEAILDRCARLGRDMERFAADHEVLGRHLQNAYTRYTDSTRRLDVFRAKLEGMVDLTEGEDPRPPLEVVNEA